MPGLRRPRRSVTLPILALLVAAGLPEAVAQSDSQSAAEWSRVEGGPGTGCVQDSTFAFFVHAGNPGHLMVYFAGGGACWNGGNCDLKGQATFKPAVGPKASLGIGVGLLDVNNPANPIADYSIVVVPYCTGDVHLGSRVVTYRDSLPVDVAPRSFVIRHQGWQNAASALGWLETNWKNPDVVFVTGSSAGAIPTPVFATELARHYPRARVVQLGDAAGGYRAPAIPSLLAQWGATQQLRQDATYRRADSARLTFESLYTLAARAAPRIQFAQYNNAEDQTQLFFLGLLGVHGVRLQDLLRENLAELRTADRTFRSYTAPGNMHTILGRPEFYTLRVDKVAVRDWVAALLNGVAVSDVGESLLRTAPQ